MMFDPKMKWVSFNQLFIFPVIALILVTSLAIAQETELEEVLLEESATIEASRTDTNLEQKSLVDSPPATQSNSTDINQQTKIEMAVGGQTENPVNESLFGMLALLIPHVAIVSGLIVGLALIRFLIRWRELVHKEHLLAIEKGLKFQMNRKRLMLWGMLWMGLGISVGAALWVNFNWSNAMWSLMPLLLGIVLLVYVGFIEKNKPGVRPEQVSSTT